jgi:hypothetical protein
MATTYTIQSAEIDVQFIFTFTDSVTNDIINLTGATVTLISQSPTIGKVAGSRTVYTCSIASNFLTATYSTVGTEFTTPNSTSSTYQLQAWCVGPLGTHHTEVFNLKVLPNL